jgi:glycosyltransferase involved in cell wall biosynthesis
MLEWLSDDAAALGLREQCRSYVEANYGWDLAVDALEETVRGLLEGGERSG